MKPDKRLPLRRLAEGEPAKKFLGLSAAVRDQLATSLVRQWLTNDGHAGIVTPTQQVWFRLVAEGDLLEVKVNTAEGDWGRALSRHWGGARGRGSGPAAPAQPLPVRLAPHRSVCV
jgi:hypothetical protein